MEPARILIAYAASGGGHASVAAAIAEGLVSGRGQDVDVRRVDILVESGAYPITRLPAWYPVMVGPLARIWASLFKLTDGRRRVGIIHALTWPLGRRVAHRLVAGRPFDALVIVHPLGTDPLVRALAPVHPPVVTVVTDLVTTHAWWYPPGSDAYVVATESARQRALQYQVPPERLHVLGLPVDRRFSEPPADRAALRTRLGWTSGLPVVLLLGGGEGLGPVIEVARAISDARLPCELAVVAGRNERLRNDLEGIARTGPSHVYGFSNAMPDLMHAADILVTKAGPSTICESLCAGIPLVLFARLPGQEDGNVAFVTEQGAGLWAPGPSAVVAALRRWIPSTPERDADRRRMAANTRRLARPTAARDVADLVLRHARQWQHSRTGASSESSAP